MAADIVLEETQVRVEAWDLVVDAKDRRKTPDGDRRAIVHDAEDGLTINWGGDYPGGVTVLGNMKFQGHLPKIEPTHPTKGRPKLPGPGPVHPLGPTLNGIIGHINKLLYRVQELEKRVAEMEKKSLPV